MGPLGFLADPREGAQASWSLRGGLAAEAQGRWGFTLDALLSSGYTVLGADLEGPFIPIFQRFLNNAFRFSP